jgi:hypothetical protein
MIVLQPYFVCLGHTEHEEFCGLDQVLTVYEQKPMKLKSAGRNPWMTPIYHRDFAVGKLVLRTSRVTVVVYGFVRGFFFPLVRGQKHSTTAPYCPYASDNKACLSRSVSLTNPFK